MNKENSSEITNSMESGTKVVVHLTLSFTVFFISFMIQALNVALPSIGREFGANAEILGWIVTSYILAVVAFSVPFGRIADIVGLRKIIITGAIVYTLSSFVALFSYSSMQLIICRAIQGISAAMILVNVIALITAIFPAEERGQAVGINITGIYLGSTLGPFLGGILTGYFGWRSIFLINIPINILVIVLLGWKVKGEWCANKGQKMDYCGWIIYASALIIWMYGFSLLPKIKGVTLILIGIIGLLLFIKWEKRTESPMFDINIFSKNRTFIFSNLAVSINYSAVFAVAFLLSLYLQYIKGLTPEQAGIIMIAHPVVQAILSPLTGRLSDKIEPRIVASIGMVITCLGLFSFIFLSNNTSLLRIVIGLIIIGIGFAFFLSANTNALMSSVAPAHYGVASATMSTMISFGQMMSMGITMVISAIVIGGVAITPAQHPAFLTSTKIGFGIFTLLCFVGIFISFFRSRAR